MFFIVPTPLFGRIVLFELPAALSVEARCQRSVKESQNMREATVHQRSHGHRNAPPGAKIEL
jgi:hypothetical protein